MNNTTYKGFDEFGNQIRLPVDLERKLNVPYYRLLRRTELVTKWKIPKVSCNTQIMPDFIGNITNQEDFHFSAFTAVGFYGYDDEIDPIDGLYNAIEHDSKQLLLKYKKMFNGVRIFISPDYSAFSDWTLDKNIQQLKKSRIVALWLIFECHAVVIPNLIYISEETFPIFFAGLENCTVAALSLKSHCHKDAEQTLTRAAVRYITDHTNIQTLVVYSACRNADKEQYLLQYAIDNGVRIVIPDNRIRRLHQKEEGLL